MALNLKLQMRLSQQLIMTPQLQQAIKLLQLSRTELEELIEQALIENPVLEEGDGSEDSDAAEEPGDITEMTERVGEAIKDNERPENDLDWEQYIASGSGVIPETYSRASGDEPSLEATLASANTLQEHLLWQLEMTSLSELEKEIGEQLIGNLDDDGYLTISIQELLESSANLQKRIEGDLKKNRFTLPMLEELDADCFTRKHLASRPAPDRKKKKKAPPQFEEEEGAEERTPQTPQVMFNQEAGAAVETVLCQIQNFDPTGVCARSLQECLEIQLTVLGLGDDLAFRIVHEDLKLLENKDLRKIARRRKADLQRVIDAYKLIMALEPKPGRPFGEDRAQHIIPDVFIYKYHSETEEGDDRVGDYRVVLNESGLPRLRVSNYYQGIAEQNKSDSSLTHEYIREKIKAGNWLMKSIEQRQKTIFRVTKSILKHQHKFFDMGIDYLRPLVLKDIAEDIEVHESTVSRITTNKYVHTPQGIYELKYFFTSGIDQGFGEIVSSKKIKDMIQRIINSEDAREPYTDIQIAEQLSDDSKIKVARRTVAKYREALNLLPSNKRKQLF
ncbi:MAG: RNA polymerase factor sigma-54 [SAR324 cluster bacterium]|nr:RNA polymerase factor sigma-54 [SAR324 cluster bacterium]